jgi:hypothetical protein
MFSNWYAILECIIILQSVFSTFLNVYCLSIHLKNKIRELNLCIPTGDGTIGECWEN